MKGLVQLNIVAFNTPFPPDYGGSIDVFYKIKSLSEAGCRIYLHCFTYRSFKPQPELEKLCEKVFYYPRGKSLSSFFSKTPYIVKSRRNPGLLLNLEKSGNPILFEGLHTCGWLDHDKLAGKVKIVRMHNIEHQYYKELSNASTNPFKKIFYYAESLKLRRFEKKLLAAGCIAAISPNDQNYFASWHPQSLLVPAFHPFSTVTSKPGSGTYFLYHGNLSVEENLKVVKFLINKVFKGTYFHLVVAGKNPPVSLKRLSGKFANIILRENPSKQEMDQLISDAQGCIIPTFQDTGLKLKLLGSLFAGRHCVVNNTMVSGTGLEELCLAGETPGEFRSILQNLWNRPFTEKDIEEREEVLFKLFSNRINSERLINTIIQLQE